MTSERKIEANRRNALRSTGPRSPEEKARVAQNPLKHGLLSPKALLPGEDPQRLKELAEALRAELNPRGPLERVYADLMISAVWRRRRFLRVEACLLRDGGYETLARLYRYGADSEKGIYRAHDELKKLQHAHSGGQAPSASTSNVSDAA